MSKFNVARALRNSRLRTPLDPAWHADRGSKGKAGRWRYAASLVAVAGTAQLFQPIAHAGGTPENALILIDPSSAESMFIGNYYKNARKIPDANVLYMDPDAPSYATFVAQNVVGLSGYLANASLGDHIDYIIITPGNSFYVSASGLLGDGCSPINRFAITSAYSTAFISADILPPISPMPQYSMANKYFSTTNTPVVFDSNSAYLNGSPSVSATAKRYYISALLGYNNFLGNTLEETQAMIDSSVAVDGTHPTGTFYFMNNTGDAARNVRATQFTTVVSFLQSLGFNASKLNGEIPIGAHDILGVMAGFAGANINAADITIKPGAFCDHLTSYAGMFDLNSQTKMSQWIRRGASGTVGEVEEPCNYVGKFPHARMHVYYSQGASLGEAYFRSAQYVPFQALLYGDPLTRPFAYLPVVSVSGLSGGPVSGTIVISPSATTDKPGGNIKGFDLHIDGKFVASCIVGQTFAIDTTTLADGTHDLRVLGYDDSFNRTTGRFLGTLTTSNRGLSTSLNTGTPSGDLATPYTFNVAASGGTPAEIRLLLNGRVVGTRTSNGPITVDGQNLGAGNLNLQAETIFNNGASALSPRVPVNITYAPGTPSGVAPVAFSYTKHVRNSGAAVIELPASFDNDPTSAMYTIVTPPTKANILAGFNAFRTITPTANPCGTDTIAFRVTTVSGTSNIATVTLVYDRVQTGCAADFNGDGFVNGDDFDAFSAAFEFGLPSADFDNDCFITGDDFDAFAVRFELGC